MADKALRGYLLRCSWKARRGIDNAGDATRSAAHGDLRSTLPPYEVVPQKGDKGENFNRMPQPKKRKCQLENVYLLHSNECRTIPRKVIGFEPPQRLL